MDARECIHETRYRIGGGSGMSGMGTVMKSTECIWSPVSGESGGWKSGSKVSIATGKRRLKGGRRCMNDNSLVRSKDAGQRSLCLACRVLLPIM